MQIYIHKNNEQLGPFNELQISNAIKSGQFSLYDHAWTEGQTEWVPLMNIWEKIESIPNITNKRSETNKPMANQPIVIGLVIIVCIIIISYALKYISSLSLLNSEMKEAQEMRANSDIESLRMSLMTYQILNYRLPTNEQGLKALSVEPVTEPKPRKWKKLISSIPTDPWGSEYVYRIPSKNDEKSFDLFSLGADKKESYDDIGK